MIDGIDEKIIAILEEMDKKTLQEAVVESRKIPSRQEHEDDIQPGSIKPAKG